MSFKKSNLERQWAPPPYHGHFSRWGRGARKRHSRGGGVRESTTTVETGSHCPGLCSCALAGAADTVLMVGAGRFIVRPTSRQRMGGRVLTLFPSPLPLVSWRATHRHHTDLRASRLFVHALTPATSSTARGEAPSSVIGVARARTLIRRFLWALIPPVKKSCARGFKGVP